MRIDLFEQIRAFYSFVFDNQKLNIKSQHIALYIFLLNQNNRNKWTEWFKCPYDLAMMGSCISSKKTYYSSLNDLEIWGLIKYEKGINSYKSPLIKVEVLKDTSTVPQCEPQQHLNSTSIVTSTAPILKQETLNIKQETEINKDFEILEITKIENHETFFEKLIIQQSWMEVTSMALGLKDPEFKELKKGIKKYLIEMEAKEMLLGRSEKDLKSHFVSWARIEIEKYKKANLVENTDPTRGNFIMKKL